jgi:hypothetical protein
MTKRIMSVLCAIAMAIPAFTPAQAADVIAPGPYADAGPASPCAEDRNLKAIERRFRIQARKVHHQPRLAIEQITNIRENRHLAKDKTYRAVERIYCRASAHMSDGHSRKLWYLIEVGEGFAGFGLAFGDNVEFCLSGLDRWNVYDGYCRVLR